uniref:Uncharacterized protein n=1 Tax=Candidatus Kentrum sp. LFY TaxID=2126342 RepID=A0A450V1Y5_9GAMM|nr:MAG: hypothetical protein BECKLFY1418A_GA0070994_10892 [Candidatus Kentron sp. LFY]
MSQTFSKSQNLLFRKWRLIFEAEREKREINQISGPAPILGNSDSVNQASTQRNLLCTERLAGSKMPKEPTLEVKLVARKNNRPLCFVCTRPRPGYDTVLTRRFEFIPIWGIKCFFVYAPHRVNCPTCGIRVERIPWVSRKHRLTHAYTWFLAGWSKRLSWKESEELEFFLEEDGAQWFLNYDRDVLQVCFLVFPSGFYVVIGKIKQISMASVSEYDFYCSAPPSTCSIMFLFFFVWFGFFGSLLKWEN